MRLFPLWLAGVIPLAAGVIQGVVLDWASGKPLSRTIVHLRPVDGSGVNLRPMQLRSGRGGQFQFPSVPDGLYLLEARREGFLPAAFNQRRPEGHGSPIPVTADSSIFAELRLHRMGAITGAVFDENGIGIPRVPVVAYRAQLPLRVAGRGVTDDRGIYRIAGLELGRHWVRTSSHTLDDGTGLLPVFGPESSEPRDALLHDVRFDGDTPDAHIRPVPGTLFTLEGIIQCDGPPHSPVTVTLSSEFAQLYTEAICGGGYTFQGLAPAVYEVSAAYADGSVSAFAEQYLGQNTNLPLRLISSPPVAFDVRNAATSVPLAARMQLFGRRAHLSGPGPIREIPLTGASLPAGHWELAAAVGPSHYVASIGFAGRDLRRPWRAVRPPEWFPVAIEPSRGANRVLVLISEGAAQLSGTVTSGGKPAPGIPVFLWPETEDVRRRLGGPKEERTDAAGRFRFTGLPPGAYRALATMDARQITAELAEEARAQSVTLAERQTTELNLSVWIAP